MYFDRPTVFAEELPAATRPARLMTYDTFRTRVQTALGKIEALPETIREGYRNVPPGSGSEEYDFAVQTVARNARARDDYVRELGRRRARPGPRAISPPEMERRLNGDD